MKKWVVILIIFLLLAAMFAAFAMQYDFGSNLFDGLKNIGSSTPFPPALPD